MEWHVARLLAKTAWEVWRQEGNQALWRRTRNWIAYLQARRRRASRRAYGDWLGTRRATPRQLASQREVQTRWAVRPKISFLTPVWNVDPSVLDQTISSVRAQSYPEWELCLADGASRDPALREVMRRHAGQDPRVQVAFLEANRGISGNSNAALALATGEFVAILDHDDLVEPDFAFHVVEALQAAPATDVVYVDEDKVTADAGQHQEPLFKPAWAPDTLLCSNYLMHSVFRTSLVREVGGFDPATDGSQDWDLALKCLERTARVVHVPRVLYHWRMVRTSTARSAAARPEVYRSQEAAVQGHLRRTGHRGVAVDARHHGHLRTSWQTPVLPVHLVVWGDPDPDLFARTLQEARRAVHGSTGSVTAVAWGMPPAMLAGLRHPGVSVLPLKQGETLAAALNRAASAAAPGAVRVWLRAGVAGLAEGWLGELSMWAREPGIGFVAGHLHRRDGRNIRATGYVVDPVGFPVPVFDGMQDHHSLAGSTTWYRNHSCVAGDFVAVRDAVWQTVGGLHGEYRTGAAFLDASLRATGEGFRNLVTPDARGVFQPVAERVPIPHDDLSRFADSWRSLGDWRDGFLNPNLVLVGSEPRLARASRAALQTAATREEKRSRTAVTRLSNRW